MRDRNIKDVLSRANVSDIKSVLSKYKEESYDFLKEHFCFLPREYCLEKENIDKEPIEAIMSILHDVDGANGMKTSYTPKAVITLYKLLWNDILDTKNPIKLKGKKPFNRVDNYFYEMKWKEGINGKVSGDILNSFPKKRTIELLSNLDNFQLKLFARLCYTLGNFIPVPCIGRGRNSINSIHSYFKNGDGYIERMDYFLYDIIIKKNESKYNEDYKKFGNYIENDYINKNYLNDYIENNYIFDLATEQGKIGDQETLTRLSNENINIYIMNVNARIIARGNRMLEKLSNDANKDVLLMFTNDIEY
jgi:hypothetical protein